MRQNRFYAGRVWQMRYLIRIIKKGDAVMNERTEIVFMQARLLRLASEEWHVPIQKVMSYLINIVSLNLLKIAMVFFIWKAIMRFLMKLKLC